MLKGRLPILIFCLLCMFGLLLMQVYWIQKMYKATQENFDKEINLAFEASVKEEFDARCDHIERQISNKLMDTSAFVMIANKKNHENYVYSIANKRNLKDVSNGMSISNLDVPIIAGDTINRRKIANAIAKMIRIVDLETHTLYYRTQQLGNYIDSLVKKNDFNPTALTTIYDRNLSFRNIHISYNLFFTGEAKQLPKRTSDHTFLTKLYVTYAHKDTEAYVGAKFGSPFAYVATNMALGFGSSVLLVVGIAFCLIFLLKSLFKEKKLSEVKSDFISNITHEFKTPLATIAVAIEALTSFDVLQDKQKTHRYLGHAKTELNRLCGLVDQLLTIALYQNKNIALQIEQVNLNQVIAELLEIQQLSTVKKVKFLFEQQQSDYKLNVNRAQFYHALNNVLDNAIKYSEDEVEITVSATKNEKFLLITITDNGFGIKTEELPLLFNQFYRSPTILDKNLKGYGLGLNYVKYIMNHHKGWYSVESIFGEGSSFTLAWPL